MPLLTTTYWYTLEDILIQNVKHDYHKFDYTYKIDVRKHIIADLIRYIGKESNNLDEICTTDAKEEDYLEYTKDYEITNSEEFLN